MRFLLNSFGDFWDNLIARLSMTEIIFALAFAILKSLLFIWIVLCLIRLLSCSAISLSFKHFVRRSASQTVATFLQIQKCEKPVSLRRLHKQYTAFLRQKTES